MTQWRFEAQRNLVVCTGAFYMITGSCDYLRYLSINTVSSSIFNVIT